MSKYMKRWISMLLAGCLVLALCAAGLSEAEDAGDVIVAEAFGAEAETAAEAAEADDAEAEAEEEIAAAPVEALPEDAWAEWDLGDAEAPEDEVGADEDEGSELELGEDVPYAYAWTTNSATGVYLSEDLVEPFYTLQSGEAVLVVERLDDAVRAAFNTRDGAVEGYIDADDIEEMDAQTAADVLDQLAAFGDAALYEGDLSWPLPLSVRGTILPAADFTRQSNDKQFVVQGKTITARMVGNYSDCWSWARALYKIIWGVKFSSDFTGDPVNGHNLIRNLTDAERTLTGEHLKQFMMQSVPGCTLRIASCPKSCSNINIDGCSKHEKHSLIVVEIGEDGFVVMDNVTGNGTDRFDTRYYTYDNFAKHWAKYKMVKYIKWPNAPEFDRAKAQADANVMPESVTLGETSLTVRAESTQALTATVLPENAKDRTVTWSSSDPFVAYMNDKGELVAVATGKTTITATTINGLTAKAEVTVVAKNLKATGVKLDQSGTVYLSLGSTLQLNAAVQPAYANPALAWKSSKKAVATVSSAGLVTPKKAGTTTITVKTASKKTAKVKVKVLKGSSAGKVTLDQKGTVTLNVGETLKLNATVSPATAKTTLKWKSSKKAVATVSSDGTVTPVKAGTATIAVVTANKKTAKVKVKVQDPNAPKSVSLNQSGTVTLPLGETLQLTPTLSPETAQTSYKWKSSKKKVAKVDANGLVTPVKKGTCVIAVVTSNKKVAKVKVKVVAAGSASTAADATDSVKPTAVTLDKTGTVSVKVGQTLQLTPSLTPEGAQTSYKWASSNAKIAKVDSNGLVYGVKAGTCTVGVVTANKKTAKVKIKVSK